MDRPPHNFAAASANSMAYTQQQRQVANIQQQFGFHPQHQQFPTTVPAPFLQPHPSQFPYHPHMQVQHQPQLHPQLLHLQQQQQPPPNFPSHLPPHLVSSPFPGVYDSPPLPTPPPSDPDLQKRIDKLVEYAAKNGPEFEAMIREKQQDNPDYNFLFGGEGNGYYRYKLWLSTRPQSGPYPSFPQSSVPTMHPPTNPAMNPSSLNAPAIGTGPPPPQLHQPAFPPFYDQQHHYQHPQPFVALGRPDYVQSFKGLSGPLPSDIAMELTNMLSNLNGTKESIKSTKIWFMQRSPFAPALAEALRDRIFTLDDSERQLHVIYLVNDILFDSLQRRANPHDLDNEALAFKPVLGSMLARIYHNPQNGENRSRLQRILQFWASKEVYSQDDIYVLESEMISGPPGPPKELSHDSVESSVPAGILQDTTHNNVSMWQLDKQSSIPNVLDQADKQGGPALLPSLVNQQFLPNSVPTGAFPGSVPLNSNPQSSSQQQSANIGEKLPAYPLFPPGLIPGMVRKMQIGSGVPYCPLSPLDIPTVIPPSDVSPSEVLDRVSKFFKEIGEVNPSEGSLKSNSRDEDDEDEMEPPVRRGGACIPPPPNQQADPDSGAYTEQKPGPSGSGRLGLGATANPNEASQYDDVYISYRKQRSTSYHSSMSARAATR
ncbi:phosphoenolpyruvate carboxylase 2-like isoform X1 [Hibiscus syriacus]|uniref:Phosphoenolpyruvate carboxylase 2-like isoform X1 n=1 Tax=Hibiscus syriacus TaxID=106335 RepID=A0A6A3AM84_HIBSY|nr:uncharacterized protein LOC120124510 [Hibiscus syriacus]KAE8705730.1 phosphoenolpyruvate carboxylase 2-like isoform X1 [Hibiscus syriacus]